MPEESEALLGELVAFEEALFTDLGLHFKVLVRAQGSGGLGILNAPAQCLAASYWQAQRPAQHHDMLLGSVCALGPACAGFRAPSFNHA